MRTASCSASSASPPPWTLLAAVTPVGARGIIRWQLAGELVADVGQLELRIAVVEARSKTAVAQAKTSLLGLFGGGAGAGR